MKYHQSDTVIHTDQELPIFIYNSHYSVTICCDNCKQQDFVMVKKGVGRKYLTTICTNCGCEVKL